MWSKLLASARLPASVWIFFYKAVLRYLTFPDLHPGWFAFRVNFFLFSMTDAVSISDCTASSARTNGEWWHGISLGWSGRGLIQKLYRHLPEWTEDNRVVPQSEQPVAGRGVHWTPPKYVVQMLSVTLLDQTRCWQWQWRLNTLHTAKIFSPRF